MLNIVNRAYAKKLLIILAGQMNPEHFHRLKEETHVLQGEVDLTLDGEARGCSRRCRHDRATGEARLWEQDRAVIEEISTTHFGPDSYYLDPVITANPNRKTFVTHWMGYASCRLGCRRCSERLDAHLVYRRLGAQPSGSGIRYEDLREIRRWTNWG